MKNVAVLGTGSWGTALAMLLAKKGIKVNLWGRDQEKLHTINRSRENIYYLPGIVLPHDIEIVEDLETAVQGVKYIVLSVPSHIVRDICHKLKPFLKKDMILINTGKGIETSSLKRLSEVINEEVSETGAHTAVLSGPSHAEEVARDIPTAVVVGAQSRKIAEEIQDLFMSPKFRVYTNPDLIGIELGAALKNAIALGTGIAEGLGYGDNTKAALITRGAAEIASLGSAAGANPLTFAGLAGIGDLIVTCTSMHSRNRRAGILLGKGIPLEQAVSEIGMVVEGVRVTQAAYALSEKYGVSMPICTETYKVLFEHKNPREAVIDLMMRPKKHEVEDVADGLDW
ncbi:MAG: NAD(P)H-dependent glycerol-3-phosphate dehydrogenase [Firmicutes bacterium HGW-Firmicutes-12]|nr:MAG: NAD(P)H-dependent glycerol-3-phosphate dehydrogenase [Firmicutes bacterium HGW-Firmicutes-12]